MSVTKIFLNKRFFLHITSSLTRAKKAAEFIKTFGGIVEEFLDHEVTYLLTDVPKNKWPPAEGADHVLQLCAERATCKLMSLKDLEYWCAKYLSSQSSSDDDDDIRAHIRQLHEPFIKFEDAQCRYAPFFKEFTDWPEVNLRPTMGRSIFWDPSRDRLADSTPTPTRQPARRRLHYCDVCQIRLENNLEEHIESQAHKTNIARLNWDQMHSVIDSVPGLESLASINIAVAKPLQHHEFFCLHRVESVSQLFPH